jgi:uncharacterized protein (DUF2336 family)
MAEVGEADACLALLENPGADFPRFSIDRIIGRFGHLAPIRENLLAREDLSTPMRQALLSKLSQTLAGFVTARQWLESEHAEFTAREACEKATVALAADTSYDEVAALVRYLRQSGQLTAGMLLRALLSGNVVLFEEALAELSGISIDRVTAYIHDKNISGFRALYREAGLPDTAYPAFRETLAAMRAGFLVGEQGGAARLKRRMVERVLGACAHERGEDTAALLALLRRFAVEAAREEARLFCDDLWRKPQFFRPTNRMSRSIWRRRSRHLRVAYSGTIEKPLSWSRTSERPRFSYRRNSPVTSCRRLVNVAASSLASERAYSR